MTGRVLLLATLLSATASGADSPERPSERFYFGAQVGVTQAQIDEFTTLDRGVLRGYLGGYSFAASAHLGFSFSDYLATQLELGMQGLDLGEGALGIVPTVAASVKLSLPLRYGAPYLNLGVALRGLSVDELNGTNRWRGAHSLVAPKLAAGWTMFLDRYLWLYADLDLIAFDTRVALYSGDSGPFVERFGGLRSPCLSFGVAGNPELFRRSPDQGLVVFGALMAPALAALIMSFTLGEPP